MNVLFMPLFIERLRDFVAYPTIKNWGRVSRLVKDPEVRSAIMYGRRGYLPMLMCNNQAQYHGCHECAMSNGYTNGPSRYTPLYLSCRPYAILHQRTLAERLLIGTQILAAYDEMDTFASLASERLENTLKESESRREQTLSIRRTKRVAKFIQQMLASNEYADAEVLNVVYNLLKKSRRGKT